jgi:hypothetical protein
LTIFNIGDIVCLKDNDKFIGVIVGSQNYQKKDNTTNNLYRIQWLTDYKKVRVLFHGYLLKKVSEV